MVSRMAAGINKIEPMVVFIMVRDRRKPNRMIGIKLEVVRTRKPQVSARDV